MGIQVDSVLAEQVGPITTKTLKMLEYSAPLPSRESAAMHLTLILTTARFASSLFTDVCERLITAASFITSTLAFTFAH